MSEVKTNILETVIEEAGGDLGVRSRGNQGKMNKKSHTFVSNTSTKGQKNGQLGRTKRVIVKLPTVSRRTDDEYKVFPKGIESTRRALEEIKEEARENKFNSNDEHKDAEQAEDFGQVPVQDVTKNAVNGSITDSNEDILNAEAQKILSDQIYGMFTRTNTERSFLSDRSDSILLSLPMKKKKRKDSTVRPKSSCGWSKREMDLFLPRKSFFSVHDNTMSAAGFDIRSDEERKRPDWRKILRMHTEDELHPPEKEEEEKPPNMFGMMDDESGDESFGLENVETAVSAAGKDSTSGNKGKKKQSSKKVVTNEKEEYKPLYDYLKYIHDNPDEYVQAAKFTTKNIDHKHPNNMVRLGRAYRRGHHGVVKNNIFLHAITGMKPKLTESSPQRTTRNEKAGSKKETDGVEASTTQDETEIEKLKSKAEKWMKGLTTQQYLKARELALKDVGEEDANMSKWWMAFKSCHYLRMPSHISDSS